MSLFLLFWGKIFQQGNLEWYRQKLLAGRYNRKKIVKFLMRTFTCRSTFLYDWMMYRGPDFLVVIWFVSSPPPPPLPLRSVSSTGDTQWDWEGETTCWEERGKGVGEEPIIRPQKAWSYINHSILSEIERDDWNVENVQWMSLTEVLGNGSKVQCRKYRMGVKSAYGNTRTEVQYCAEMPGLEYRTVPKSTWMSLQLCTMQYSIVEIY
jgi:hypothetical protein